MLDVQFGMCTLKLERTFQQFEVKYERKEETLFYRGGFITLVFKLDSMFYEYKYNLNVLLNLLKRLAKPMYVLRTCR